MNNRKNKIPKPRDEILKLATYHPGKSVASGGLKLSSNENPIGSSADVPSAIAHALQSIHRYPDAKATELRAAIARHHSVSPDQCIVGNGSDELITLAAAAFLAPGQTALIGQHTFSIYAHSVRLFGGRVIYSPMPEGVMTIPSIVSALDQNPRIIFICNPNNPTGRYMTKDTLTKLLNAIPSDTLVVIDEAYADFATADDFPDSISLLEHHPNLLALRTFSKIYGLAGLRIGYGIGNAEIISWLFRCRSPFSVNTVAQLAAKAALADREFYRTTRDMIRDGREYWHRHLTQWKITHWNSQANFVAMRLPAGAAQRLLQEGIAARALESFGLPNWVRITVGTRGDVERSANMVKQLRL